MPILEKCLSDDTFIQLTISKPRRKNQTDQVVFIRPIIIKKELVYQVTTRTKTQDFFKNYSMLQLVELVSQQLEGSFFNANLFTTEFDIQYLQSKKGKEKVISTKATLQKKARTHNKQKQVTIPVNTPYLQSLKLTTSDGKIIATKQRKYKQINQYIGLLQPLIQDNYPKSCYDMGSGKGYLTFALYDFISRHQENFQMTGIEIRNDLVTMCNEIAQHHQLNQLRFEQGSIVDYQIKHTDMVIALHACDIATDMAIATGIHARANYIVVAPCCHKQIRSEMNPSDSVLSSVIQHGIFLERQAEMITDTIRALLLESKGYQTKVFEFISNEHTAKNIMITAKYTGKVNYDALEKIETLKSEFGIQTHYLETLISRE